MYDRPGFLIRRANQITRAGLDRLPELEGSSRRAQDRTPKVFSPEQAAQFLQPLRTFVDTLNEDIGASIRDPGRD